MAGHTGTTGIPGFWHWKGEAVAFCRTQPSGIVFPSIILSTKSPCHLNMRRKQLLGEKLGTFAKKEKRWIVFCENAKNRTENVYNLCFGIIPLIEYNDIKRDSLDTGGSTMNRYNDFFTNMSDEEWEKFAVEVLKCAGYRIRTLPAYGIDGGKDFSVSYDNEIYLVSCKHYIRSGNHVGQDDEVNICDRLVQFNAKGFIGFYSTGITTGLQNRLDAICENQNRSYIIFDPSTIVTIMQYMDTKILQSFGLYPHKYYLNVADMEYQPLKCRICKKDCLTDENIPNSLIGLAKFKDGKYDYVYGCKSCFLEVELYLNLHLEMEQALHVGQLQGWEDKIDKIIENDRIELSEKFYKHRSKFLNCVRQRQLPQTEGTWYGIE